MDDSEDKWERLARLNQKPSRKSNSFAGPPEQPPANLRLLAVGYVMLTYSIVAQMAVIILMVILGLTGIGLQLPEIVGSMLGLVFLFSALFIFCSLMVIAVASRTIVTAFLVCLGYLIPCVNFFVVWTMYLEAKQTLQRNRVKIGFFGVDFDSINDT